MSKAKSLLLSSALLVAISMTAQSGDGPLLPTVTNLVVNRQNIEIGASVTLTAKVKSGSTPVQHGSIVFCEASSTRCDGAAVVGRAQLTRDGSASLKVTLAAGNHAIVARFAGTPNSKPGLSSSSSQAQEFSIKATRHASSEGITRQ